MSNNNFPFKEHESVESVDNFKMKRAGKKKKK